MWFARNTRHRTPGHAARPYAGRVARAVVRIKNEIGAHKMRVYKLTDENGRTRSETQWGENVTHIATGIGNYQCSDGVIHAYLSPEVAVFCNPIHANFKNPRMWESEMEVTGCDGLKLWGKSLRTIREIPVSPMALKISTRVAERCVDFAAARATNFAAVRAAAAARAAVARATNFAARAAARAAAASAAAADFAAGATAAARMAFNIGLWLIICEEMKK